MAFTDNSDIFAAFHEDGVNRIIGHVRRQRPSLFNYATADLVSPTERLCRPIDAHPIVALRSNPRVTIVDPLPVPGTNYGMAFSVQLTELKLDLHPGNVIPLPPELAPLPAQRMALGFQACVGLGCPPRELIDRLIPPPEEPPGKGDKPRDPASRPTDHERPGDRRDRPPLIPLPVREPVCFCLSVFAVLGVRIKAYAGKHYLEPFLEGLEIVDIKPDGLEHGLECYVSTILRLSLLPKLRILLEDFTLELMQGVSAVIKPAATSASLPNNPAIEQHELKAFVSVEVV